MDWRVFGCAAFLAFPFNAAGQPVHYDVKLLINLDTHELRGREEIRFEHTRGVTQWQKQAGLSIIKAWNPPVDFTQSEQNVSVRSPSGGKQKVRFEYTAAETRGFRWLPDNSGLFTAFYCEAWMICSTAPDQRTTLRLEIVVPVATSWIAVGPGRLRRTWKDSEGKHFLFEQSVPTQTYLFSFGVGKFVTSTEGDLTIYARTAGHARALDRTASAYTFFRQKAGVAAINKTYAQAFLPQRSLAQEAAGLALLSEDYLVDIEQMDDVILMAHELAHQWWGVSVGIRSWSDFWLNEGMAEFMSLAYLEHELGRAAYLERIATLRIRLDELRAIGADRPLHWEKWKDPTEALGRIPYVKGALFLDRLRSELGDETFWQGIAVYTSRHTHRLVDSRDFQRAMEEASRRNLSAVFDEAVYQ